MREHERSVQPWGTLEELLLASAVNRHGTNRWDSVAVELHSRSSAAYLTPETCHHRFDHLKRRFSVQNDGDESASLLVDRLTKIRVDELRREIRRRDSLIVSLELEVKRLEEDRETSLKAKTENNWRVASSQKDVRQQENCRGTAKSEDTNRATQRREDSNRKRRAVAPEKPEMKPEKNDESDRAREEKDNEAVMMMRESNNTKTNNDNIKINSTKQSSKVQSFMKRRRRGVGNGEDVSPAIATNKRISAIKSEPLIPKLLGMIRSHRLGFIFQRRLHNQESQRHKNTIRQHIDLRTIEGRLEKGVYSDNLNKFFRDLLLLFTNAIVFFREESQEHVAAKDLRSLVLKDMKDNNNKVGKAKTSTIAKPEPKIEGDDNVLLLKPKNKSSIIVTCGGRRKSTTLKAASEGSNKKGSSDSKKARVLALEKEKRPIKGNERERINGSIEDKGVRKKRSQEIGVRKKRVLKSSNCDDSNERGFGGNELSSHDTKEVKKGTATKKKQGVASFLKRIKQTSPKKEVEDAENDEVKNEEANSEEEDHGKVEKERKGNRKMSKSLADVGSPSKDQRVTRNSKKSRAAKEESDPKPKRGIGRPPKKPEKAAVAGNGKRAAGRVSNGDHQPRKRSKR